jgi:demethylmenaquinone methyltransferase / 2-methoxy-6-polyprenyl-1,4-benzoquinol methylase
MFDSVAPRYDVLNRALSLGMDGWWRRQTVRALAAEPGDRVLDLGCGTGKLGALLAAECRVVGLDTSAGMLRLARSSTASEMVLVQGSATHLPFGSGRFDAALSGFVLRNLPDLPAAFGELARVLRRGGRIAMIDITEPDAWAVRALFHAFFRVAAPTLGSLAGRRSAYRYLVGSLGQLPPPPEVIDLLSYAGFAGATARPLTGGVVTLFTAIRGIGVPGIGRGKR